MYIVEKESGARPIEPTGTSTAAFLGYAPQGPSMVPTLVESQDAYAEQFGPISSTGAVDGDAMGFAVRGFFQNGGRRAYIANVSIGGHAATATLSMTRRDPVVALYTATASSVGLHANGAQVWLVPRGPDSGLFDCEVRRPAGLEVEELHANVTIAPGLPSSVESVLATAGSSVLLTPSGGLASQVFPSRELDTAAVTDPELRIRGLGTHEVLPFTVSFVGAHTSFIGDALAAECQRRIALGLAGANPAPSTDFVCEWVSGTTVRILLRCTQRDATFTVNGLAANGTRAQRMSALLTTVQHDQQAVLSGHTLALAPTQLNGIELGLRFGDEFGRAVPLDGFLADDTLSTVAGRIEAQLGGDLHRIGGHLPTVASDPAPERLVLQFGSERVPGTTVAGWDDEGDGRWSLPVAVLPVPGGAADLSITIEAAGLSGPTFVVPVAGLATIDEIVTAVDAGLQTLRNTALSGLTGIHVEAVGDQLLIRHDGGPMAVLPSAGADQLQLTEARGATTDALSTLQPTLPVVGALNGGRNGEAGTLDDYQAALASLEVRDEVAILVLPGHPWDKAHGGSSWQIVEAAIRHAEGRQDRMVIVDPPDPQWATSKRWSDGYQIQSEGLPSSSFSAVYYPWVEALAPQSAAGAPLIRRLVAPSGFAAGVWSRTDEGRGVWKAPAGVDAGIVGVQALHHELTDGEGDALNREGVNALRDIPVSGPVVWGARTRSVRTAPQWKYLPVRRLALMIEDSLKVSMLWAVHEPNRSELWSALRLNIGAFLGRLHRAGAFQPDAAREAYFVQCGLGTTMVQDDIDAGIVRVRVGIAPVKPAEFVVITIEQTNENS